MPNKLDLNTGYCGHCGYAKHTKRNAIIVALFVGLLWGYWVRDVVVFFKNIDIAGPTVKRTIYLRTFEAEKDGNNFFVKWTDPETKEQKRQDFGEVRIFYDLSKDKKQYFEWEENNWIILPDSKKLHLWGEQSSP